MDSMRILLCCGAGMSSGFLAQKARQAAKKKNIVATIDARAESEVGMYLKSIDLLCVGPHYANRMPDFEKLAESYNVPTLLIPQKIYGTLDGEALLNLAIETLENKTS